jgi:hypothetical protein
VRRGRLCEGRLNRIEAFGEFLGGDAEEWGGEREHMTFAQGHSRVGEDHAQKVIQYFGATIVGDSLTETRSARKQGLVGDDGQGYLQRCLDPEQGIAACLPG